VMLIIVVDPNSKSHGRNVRISHWRAQVVTFYLEGYQKLLDSSFPRPPSNCY
jgi:hypothetical protein